MERVENDKAVSHPSHRRDDYDEMNLISKTTNLRATHSEGKVTALLILMDA
jgi:hypothetical protein